MKKIFGFGRKKKSGPPSSTSETGSVQSAGYELKEKELSKLHRAASCGDAARVRQLLHKQDVSQGDKENRTPLHLACANGHLDVVKLLVENKAKLNACDNDNRSPVMKAIQCQHEPCATVLLEHQADPNVVDINENAALHLAALIPSLSIAVQLLEHGANINAINKDGCTPLILAITENNQEMVELLVKEGADLNLRDNNGRTPLMIAASNGHINLVKYLLQNNADSSLKDLTGWTADDYAVNDGHHACSQLIFEHGSRTKHNSSPYYGASKKKGTAMFGSPESAVGGGFTLGSPVTDKEGADDPSQAESGSSRASEDADSWPSSDEDDLDFSPKKSSKPSLTQLLHTKRNIIEKGSFTSVQPTGFTLESKSDSEEDSVHISEDEGANTQSPPKPFPQTRFLPVCINPGSLAKPSQMVSASFLGLNKDESFSGDEVDESDKHSIRKNNAQPEKIQASGDGIGRKVALMTELGFEDDDVESPWDSESASESPRKQSASDSVPPSVQAHMQCISEESNEDMYYCPSFLKPSRNCEIPDEGWHFRPREASENIAAVTPLETKKNPILRTNEGSTPNFKTTDKNKPDLMADLGLDDADDIEDASDWDSTSHSFKCAAHPQTVNSPHHKLHKTISPLTDGDKVTSKDNATPPPVLLSSVPEDKSEDHMRSKQSNLQSIPKGLLEKPQNIKTGLSNANQLANVVNNSPTEHMVMKFNLRKDDIVINTNEVISQQPLESQTVANTLDNQDSSSESDLPWEEKYEKLWVDKEKMDVKSHFKDITAELKQKFGEMCNKKKSSAKTSKSQERSLYRLDNGGNDLAEEKLASSSEKLPLAAEFKNPTCIVTSSLSVNQESKTSGTHYSIKHHNKSLEHDSVKKEPGPFVEKDYHSSSDPIPPTQKHLGNNLSLPSKKVMNNISNPSSEISSSNKHAERNMPAGKHDDTPCQFTSDNQHQNSNVGGEDPSRNLDTQLDQEMRRFKNEVVREKAATPSKEVELEKLKSGNKSCLKVETNIQLNENSKASSNKGNYEIEKSASSKTSPKKEKRAVNGSMVDGFDDSSLSEMSQEEGVRSSNKRTGKQKMNEDLADYSQSSDTGTDDSELPTSAFTNAMLLIKQLNLDGQDSLKSLKIQNIIQEYERVIEKEKGRRALLSREVKKLRRERKEVQQIMEENRELKLLLDHHKVEWESDLNNLRLTLKQEEEKRKSAEMLYDKSKEQLRKKEDQCCKEMEEKQHLELTLRNLELEMRSLKNNMKQVDEERNEAQRLHAQELNARVLNEGALNNLKKKHEEEEAKKLKLKQDEILSQSCETNEKDLTMKNITLQEEVSALKVEIENMRSHYQEEESKHVDENEILKEKIEDLRKDLKMNEETLTQTVIQYNGQLNALKTETAMMCSKIEHEKQSKERLETELETVRSRLNSTVQDLERSQALKTETDRTLQRERDEWLRSKDKLTHELSNLHESHGSLSQQLSRAESKLNGLENELHRTGLSLQDKTLLLDNTQRDLTQAQSKLKDLEQVVQTEKDHNNKNCVKQESMQERLAQITSENMQLRQQLEDVQNKGIIKEKVVGDVQVRFTELLSEMRTDKERQVQIVEERNKDLITKSNELREQLYKLETEKVDRESTIRQLQQELADALKKLSMSEASLEVITRYRNDPEEEKQQLQRELEKFRTKLQDLEDQFVQSERRNQQLKNALDDKEREMIAAFQKVQEFSTAAAGAEKAVKQLEDHVQKLEIENARIEATAKQQAGQIESLQKELHESASMRNRLEDLLTNLQSTKIGLEEKLNQQVHKQSALSQSAQDSHNLWETELKSRSQIGVRLAELEGLNSNLTDQVAVEKKKLKKLAEQKRSMEERFDQEMKRSTKLQQEVAELKKLLKTAKKRLKDCEGPEQRSSVKGGSRNYETDSEVLKMKEKMEELSSQMERESRRYTELESTNRDLQEEVSTNKKLYRNIERLERGKRQLEEELAEIKRCIDSSKTSQSYLDMYKKEVDERGRQELRQQLEEVNLFLQVRFPYSYMHSVGYR